MTIHPGSRIRTNRHRLGTTDPIGNTRVPGPAQALPRTLGHGVNNVLFTHDNGRSAVHTVNLRKVGGSIMLAVPPPLLNLLQLGAGDPVNIGIGNGRLIVQPKVGPKYTLDQLLSQCDRVGTISDEDRAWLDDKPVGEELL